MDIIDIEVVNWEKYNPKRDQKSYAWFRLNNDFNSGDMLRVPTEQRIVWIEVLCQASKKNKPQVTISLKQITAVTGVAIKKVRRFLEFAVAAGWLAICDTGATPTRYRCDTKTTPTNERTNGSSTTATATEIQDAALRQTEIQEIEKHMATIYGREPTLPERRQASRILAHFGDPKTFAEWAQAVIDRDGCPAPSTDPKGYRAYFGAALSKTLGGAA